MSYSITSMIAAPDVGFRAERRLTPRGAKDLAQASREDGRQAIEVKNDRGQRLDSEDLDRDIAENDASETELRARCAG